MNQDVYIIAAVCSVLAVLILCAVGVCVVGGLVLRKKISAAKTSSPYSSQGYKHTLEDGSRDELRFTYSVSAPPPLDDDGACIDSTIPPDCTQANETTPLSSPEQPDSGIQSVEESAEEEDGIMDTVKAERPTSIVTRQGEPVNLKRKEKESDRVSHLQDEDLFEGGLGGTVASV